MPGMTVLFRISLLFFLSINRPYDRKLYIEEFGPDHFCYQCVNDPDLYLAGIRNAEHTASPNLIFVQVNVEFDQLKPSIQRVKRKEEYYFKLIPHGCPSSFPLLKGGYEYEEKTLTIKMYQGSTNVYMTTFNYTIYPSAESGIKRIKDYFEFADLFITFDEKGDIIRRSTPITLQTVVDSLEPVDESYDFICVMRQDTRFVIYPSFSLYISLPLYASISARIPSLDGYINVLLAAWPCPSPANGKPSDIVWIVPYSPAPEPVVFTLTPIGQERPKKSSPESVTTNPVQFETPYIRKAFIDDEEKNIGPGKRIYLMNIFSSLTICYDSTKMATLVVYYTDRDKKESKKLLGYRHEAEFDEYNGLKYRKAIYVADMSTCVPTRVHV